MKLLKVVANNFKLCEKDFTISFIPIANKTEEDKEFELQKIDEDLYTFNTLGIIGKNASGKTSTVELLSIVYDILSLQSCLDKRCAKGGVSPLRVAEAIAEAKERFA